MCHVRRNSWMKHPLYRSRGCITVSRTMIETRLVGERHVDGGGVEDPVRGFIEKYRADVAL